MFTKRLYRKDKFQTNHIDKLTLLAYALVFVMGIKERLSTVKTGKPLMTAFLATGFVDMAMTHMDLSLYHGKEVNFLGAAEIMQNAGETDVFILRLALSALLVGAYALAQIHKKQFKILSSNIKTDYVTKRALQGTTIYMAGILAWNTVNLGIDVIASIKP